MAQNITGLSPREAELLTWLAGSGRCIFKLADVREHWPDESLAARTLSRLERLERGVYMLLSLEARPARIWSPDSIVTARGSPSRLPSRTGRPFAIGT